MFNRLIYNAAFFAPLHPIGYPQKHPATRLGLAGIHEAIV